MSKSVEIEKEFSSYYKSADNISINAQKRYMLAFKGTIIPLLIATGVGCIRGIFNESLDSLLFTLNTIIILCILMSILCSIVVHQTKLQKSWYEGRAVAESLKTMGWKYVNCTAPYDNHSESVQVNERFVSDLKKIINNNENILEQLNINDSNTSIITFGMEDARKLKWQEKKEIYLEQRIKSQRNWYKDKANINAKEKNKWFILSIVLQVLALGAVFFIMENSNMISDLVGFFASSSTAILSWMQVKRYQELREAYNTTAFELDIIYNQGNQINNENDFIGFVEDSERAISREHTLWIARRDHTKLKELLKDE